MNGTALENELTAALVRRGLEAGDAHVLGRYGRSRHADILSRTVAIDLANRSLLSEILPLQPARALGLNLINSIGPLRRLAMREGLAPSWWR